MVPCSCQQGGPISLASDKLVPLRLRTSAWCTIRSIIAEATVGSPKTSPQRTGTGIRSFRVDCQITTFTACSRQPRTNPEPKTKHIPSGRILTALLAGNRPLKRPENPAQPAYIKLITRRKPAVMIKEEQPRLHRLPDTAHTVAFGLSRNVPENTPPMVTFENGQYSVPTYLLGARVFVRSHGAGVDGQVVVHIGVAGPVEVARHGRARPGSPAIDDTHFPDHRPKVPGDYTIKARSAAEAEFLGIGAGAHTWLLEAAAA